MTPKLLKEWRTGLHAANPEQAQQLVARVDEAEAEVKRLLAVVAEALRHRDGAMVHWHDTEHQLLKMAEVQAEVVVRADAAERQATVLRELLVEADKFIQTYPVPVATMEWAAQRNAALADTAPTHVHETPKHEHVPGTCAVPGHVAMADVERVMRQLMESLADSPKADRADATARAFLDGGGK